MVGTSATVSSRLRHCETIRLSRGKARMTRDRRFGVVALSVITLPREHTRSYFCLRGVVND
jgi:hypothetical protein